MTAKLKIKEISVDSFFKLLGVCPLRELQGSDIAAGKFIMRSAKSPDLKKYAREAKENLRKRQELGTSFESDLPNVAISGKKFYYIPGPSMIVREDFLRWIEANYAKYLDEKMVFVCNTAPERPEILKVNIRRYPGHVRQVAKNYLGNGFDRLGLGMNSLGMSIAEQKIMLSKGKAINELQRGMNFYALVMAKLASASVHTCNGMIPDAINEMVHISAAALAAAEQMARQFIEKHDEYKDLLGGADE